jgi:hypothetical protein
MAVDLQAVSLQGTYRIGFKPPAERSLAAGELYIEVGSGAPKLWVGAMQDAGLVGNLAVFATAEAALLVPPVNRDVPAVTQAGATLNCTMGNWDGEPTAYAYQWKLDGVDAGDGTANYITVAGDVGKTAICTVSATNAAGTTVGPPSNQVMIAPEAGVAGSAAPGIEMQNSPAPQSQAEPKAEPPKEEPREEPKAEEPHSRRNHR